MGSGAFAQRILKQVRASQTEPAQTNRLARAGRVQWPEMVKLAEKILGRRWTAIVEENRDWGRDAVIYVAVRHGRHRLAEVVRRIEGLKYPAEAQGVRRFGERMAQDANMKGFVENMRRQLEKVAEGRR